ncbi:sensor histidine kinase [Phormidium tenue FACHB-886]|nr:sensor histidine kinase [Phormidium tenue FACHB-886]
MPPSRLRFSAKLPTLFRLAQRLKRMPLRAVLIIPFVLQIILVVGLTGYLSYLNGQEAVRDLVGQLEQQVGDRVSQKLETYLKTPQLVNQINADAVRLGLLNLEDMNLLERHIQSQFWQFNPRLMGVPPATPAACSRSQLNNAPQEPSPNLTYIAIGTETGNYIDLGYNPKGVLESAIRDVSRDSKMNIWQVNDWGSRTKLTKTLPNYDPRNRPWYRKPVQAGISVWVEPYLTQPYNDLSISVDRPLYNQQGTLMGVTDATLSLSEVSRFLCGLDVGQTGQVFIFQPTGKETDGSIFNGRLIGTSTGEQLYRGEGENKRGISVLDSRNTITRATANYLLQISPTRSLDSITQAIQKPFFINHQQFFVRAFPFPSAANRPEFRGLNWMVAVVVSQDDFMEQINANTRNTVFLCMLALGIAIALGTTINRWITNSIRQLSYAAEALAEGDWDRQITVHTPAELGTLSKAFNHMRQELKQSHQQLEEYSRSLEQKNQTLETLEAELRRQLNLFLHAVSHDLRNPVIGTAMVLNNLKAQPGDDLKLPRRILERMSESNQRQLDLINSLIDAHATEMWGIALQSQPTVLSQLVAAAIADLQPILDKEGTQLENRVSPELPLVKVDPLQLTRVYQNLIANALKHNPPGLTLILDAQQEGDHLRCSVTDNGVGIPPQQRKKLFDPYFRGEQKPRSVGLGLGLYLCRQIIQAHGGSIGVQSEIDKGTTFWFTLPYADTE